MSAFLELVMMYVIHINLVPLPVEAVPGELVGDRGITCKSFKKIYIYQLIFQYINLNFAFCIFCNFFLKKIRQSWEMGESDRSPLIR